MMKMTTNKTKLEVRMIAGGSLVCSFGNLMYFSLAKDMPHKDILVGLIVGIGVGLLLTGVARLNRKKSGLTEKWEGAK